MIKITDRKFILPFIFSIALSSCTFLNTRTDSNANTDRTVNSERATAGDQTSPADTAKQDSGLCANSHYPVDKTKSRAYKIRGGAPADYVLTQAENTENSFIEKREFASGTELTINWICTEEGLRTAEYTNAANFSKGNFRMETLESSGITLPKNWKVGEQWTTRYKISAKLNAGPASGGANGTVMIDSRIASLNDPVATPAGDFEAARVVSDIKMDLNISKPVTMKMTNWYAPGVGLVKQTVSSPFGADTVVEYTGEK